MSLRTTVGAASNPDNTESNLYTYDIMLRHCFGNYFDILKEMTYSPKMAEQFSFVESSSTRIAWDTTGELVFPDENYAREVRAVPFSCMSLHVFWFPFLKLPFSFHR